MTLTYDGGPYIACVHFTRWRGHYLSDKVFQFAEGDLDDDPWIHLGQKAKYIGDDPSQWSWVFTHEVMHHLLKLMDLGNWAGNPFDQLEMRRKISRCR